VGVPVLAIGVPTVIDAPTIVNDTMERFLKAIAHSEELKSVSRIFSEYSRKEKYELVREVISPEMAEMYVTPKDIDANIKIIASTLAQAINIACEDIPHILT
jgi:spore protease